ncbi:putative acetyltransferase [Loktanella fryxellensis]|uniref:Putative acetyltransferase n=1 Tax=Loktanella fryxellensis TaxID=245187 RepID=A0A1H8DBR3_9RHOB|nr:N-acetyltransferase [Loktanella fryxellensis]SEN03998.1 putative acetyltransferase [Loktanella fryxellensis]
MQFPGFIRPASAADLPAIDALLRDAFGGGAEVALIHALRKAGAMRGEQVIPLGDGIIGTYALSAMVAPVGWLCLAPVAVAPDWQGRGHGRRMVAQLAAWADQTATPVVVLGAPAFYGKAGFSSAAAARLTSPYPVAQTLLVGVGGAVPQVALRYPAAFG